MRYERKPSFTDTFKKLPEARKKKVKDVLTNLLIFFETGEKTRGLGLKRLRKDYWQIRTDLKDRILFRFRKDLIEFIIVGNHDEIKRYLKNI